MNVSQVVYLLDLLRKVFFIINLNENILLHVSKTNYIIHFYVASKR